MASRIRQLTALLALAFIIICVAFPLSSTVEAKDKKGKSARSKSSKSSKSSKRSLAKNKKRRSKKAAEDNLTSIPANYPIAPDRIEVIENGSASAPDLSRHLNMPPPRPQSTEPAPAPDLKAPMKRKNVKIDEARALQIQQALKKRGYYDGELTGAYDDETIEAMRRFQINQKISVTGYPTAHALKRLGLTNW